MAAASGCLARFPTRVTEQSREFRLPHSHRPRKPRDIWSFPYREIPALCQSGGDGGGAEGGAAAPGPSRIRAEPGECRGVRIGLRGGGKRRAPIGYCAELIGVACALIGQPDRREAGLASGNSSADWLAAVLVGAD